IFQIAEHRHAMHLGAVVGGCRRDTKSSSAQRTYAKAECVPTGEVRHARILLRACELGCLFGVVPPEGRKACHAVFRQGIRAAEAVPVRSALESEGKLRDDVAVPQQDPVQRLATGNEIGAILGEDDVIDQGIDRGVLDARSITRTRSGGGVRSEKVTLLVTW